MDSLRNSGKELERKLERYELPQVEMVKEITKENLRGRAYVAWYIAQAQHEESYSLFFVNYSILFI